MIPDSRLLRFMTVSSPVVIVSVSLISPPDSWLASARAAIESVLTVSQSTSTAMSPHTDAPIPAETRPWVEERDGAVCPNTPWLIVKADSTAKPLDPGKGVVFRGTSAFSLLDQSARPAPCNVRGTWTPADSQIMRLEFDLAHFLALKRHRPRAISYSLPEFENYHRRYGGLTLAGGERVILVNAFSWPASTPAPVWNWMVDDETVFGLRTPYYIVEYDPERRAFRGFAYKERNDPGSGVFWAQPRGKGRGPRFLCPVLDVALPCSLHDALDDSRRKADKVRA